MNASCRRILLLVFTLLAPLGAWAAGAIPAPGRLKAPPAVPNSECMDCHEAEFKAPKKGLPAVWTGVRPELFAKSVHGGLNCVDCHDTIKEGTHDSKLPPAQCASCHEGAAKQFATSIHGVKRDGGLPVAATCPTRGARGRPLVQGLLQRIGGFRTVARHSQRVTSSGADPFQAWGP